LKNVSIGPLHASDGWVYQGTATYGYTVTIWDNNTSATTFELTVLRTMGAAFAVQFCYQSCSSPKNWVSVSYRAWEATTGISNFTTQGLVRENNTYVSAIGLLNSSAWVRANLTETYDAHLPILNWSFDKTRYLAVAIAGHANVTFTPSLGLFPTDLIPGTSWSSNSTFQAAGAANYSYYFAAHGPGGKLIFGPHSGFISAVPPPGNVAVVGTYAPGSSIEFGGVTYPAITLGVLGPFSVQEGVVFVPSSVDLFGNSGPSGTGNASGATAVAQPTIDVKTFSDGQFRLAASSWRYVTSSANPYDGAGAETVDSGFAPSAAASNLVSNVTVQGEPQTPAQATADQQCLTSGSGCPFASGSSPRSLLGEVVVVGAVASIGALVALAVVARWRRLPPPAYLNAPLYPPGQTGPSAPVIAPATPRAPPPHEDDPLDHLW
jgi:hypothetical protein